MRSKTIVSELVKKGSYQFADIISDYASKNILTASPEAKSTANSRIDPQNKRLLSYLFTATRDLHIVLTEDVLHQSNFFPFQSHPCCLISLQNLLQDMKTLPNIFI